MNALFKIISLGTIVVFLNSVLKKEKPEYAILIIIVAGAVSLSYLSGYFKIIIESIKTIMENSGVKPVYVETILKIISIAYLSEYTAAVFYDANESAIGKKVEIAGKILIFVITLPVITSLANLITGML